MAFKAARLFCPVSVQWLRPTDASVESLRAFPFLDSDAIINGLNWSRATCLFSSCWRCECTDWGAESWMVAQAGGVTSSMGYGGKASPTHTAWKLHSMSSKIVLSSITFKPVWWHNTTSDNRSHLLTVYWNVNVLYELEVEQNCASLGCVYPAYRSASNMNV